jgi:hypothetical protein
MRVVADCETLRSRQSVDLVLDCEDRVDPAHFRDGDRERTVWTLASRHSD